MTIPVYERARTHMEEQKVADAILNLFTNYQGLSIIKALKDCGSTDSLETDLYFSSLHSYFVGKSISMTESDILDLLTSFENTIDYFYWTMDNVWSHTYAMIKMFASSHDMPQKILYAYRDSMTEINDIAGFSFPRVFEENMFCKHVFDFGCGSGFLLKYIIEHRILIASYTGMDKKDILVQGMFDLKSRLETPIKSIKFLTGDGLKTPLGSYDIIWLGEVLHGKQDKERFIDDLIDLLGPGQKIIISELKENTARSQFFDVKMFLHTGSMETVKQTLDCVYNRPDLEILSVDDISFYHTAVTAVVK